jgi:hypothetical protein
MLVGFNSNIVESASVQTIKVMTQSNLTAVTSILEYEISKMGYGVYGKDSSIIYADSNKLKFTGDFLDHGTIDTITYAFNPTAASGQLNTKTRILSRTYAPQGTNSSTSQINLGLVRFRMYYYNKGDTALTTNPVTRPSLIKSFKLAVNIESTVPYKETTMKYLKLNPGVYWERIIKPKNLR